MKISQFPSYYNLSSVTDSVWPLSPRPFMDLRAPKTRACRIAHQQSYYNLTSVCAGESQGGNPIGKALVKLIPAKFQDSGFGYFTFRGLDRKHSVI